LLWILPFLPRNQRKYVLLSYLFLDMKL